MNNCVTKVQHQNTKNQKAILKFPRYRTYLLIYCVFTLKNDDTVLNALTIDRFLENTSGSELSKLFDNITIKEK